MNPPAIDPGVRIGHVHLKVADLDRALAFYRDVLGFEVTQRLGRQAAFLSAGGYHHHIGLNTWESAGGAPPPPGSTGLYHTAILYPTRALLADALRRVVKAGIPLEGASDHGVSEALYLRDPRRQRRGTLLGPPARAVAARCRGRDRDVHAPPRSRGAAAVIVNVTGEPARAGGAPFNPVILSLRRTSDLLPFFADRAGDDAKLARLTT
ncbi:MAG: VOC family protein [Chthoniobacter sp.]